MFPSFLFSYSPFLLFLLSFFSSLVLVGEGGSGGALGICMGNSIGVSRYATVERSYFQMKFYELH